MGVVVLIVVMTTEMLPTKVVFSADSLLERQVTKWNAPLAVSFWNFFCKSGSKFITNRKRSENTRRVWVTVLWTSCWAELAGADWFTCCDAAVGGGGWLMWGQLSSAWPPPTAAENRDRDAVRPASHHNTKSSRPRAPGHQDQDQEQNQIRASASCSIVTELLQWFLTGLRWFWRRRPWVLDPHCGKRSHWTCWFWINQQMNQFW